MTKLLDAALRLYHLRSREQTERFLNAWMQVETVGEYAPFENTNHSKIWDWGSRRWGKEWSEQECLNRDQLVEWADKHHE